MKVVHCMRDKYDIYIGRGEKWENPFSHDKGTFAKRKVESREEAIERFKEYILGNQRLMSDLHELEGKILGCWCSPKKCHGDVLVELVSKHVK